MMSEQWSVKPLIEVAEIISGQSPKGEFYNDEGNGLPFYQGKKRFQEKYIGSPIKWTSKTTKIAYEGDILMSVRAPVGPINCATQEICIGRGLAAIRVSNHINRDFLFYQLLFKQDEISGKEGAVFPSINRKMIGDIKVVVPSIEEQQRIVSILDEVFENISTKLTNAEESFLHAEDLFSNELDTVFSQRHENWNETKLDEIGEIKTGTTPKTSESENYGDYISFIKPAAFAKDGTLIHTDVRLSEIGYGKSRPVKPFSVLMVCIGATIGKCGYNVVEVTTNQQINSLTPKNAKLYKFLYYQMLTRKFQHSVVTNAGQSTLPCLSKSKWSKLSLLVPTNDDEIESIVSRLDNLRNECDFLRGKYKRTKNSLVELKQSILQEAFNGSLTKEITA
jgi:type I restriction enzyme, S subunit